MPLHRDLHLLLSRVQVRFKALSLTSEALNGSGPKTHFPFMGSSVIDILGGEPSWGASCKVGPEGGDTVKALLGCFTLPVALSSTGGLSVIIFTPVSLGVKRHTCSLMLS